MAHCVIAFIIAAQAGCAPGPASMVLARLLVAVLLSTPSAPSWAAGDMPMKIVVSLLDQTLDVYEGDRFIERHPVSTGMAGYETPTGVFSILEKRRFHNSNIYSGAPMPFMQRLTWSGIALHAGRLPGYPASHGCIRLPDNVAAGLFSRTKQGAHVIVALGRLAPVQIAHDALPKPAPRAAASGAQIASLTPIDSSGPDPHGVEEAYFDAPLRILLTRWSGRDRLRDVQLVLQELGYEPGEPDGYMGPRTGAAIGAFQVAQGLPQTRAISDDLIVRLYAAAGKGAPPTGRIYVRQSFKPVFDAPVSITDPQLSLGTHLLTAIDVDRDAQTARWTAMELESGVERGAASAFARFSLPDHVKNRIARMLTPGSSIAITDRGLGPDTTPKGTDFIVLTNRSL
ncbi:MAG: L,D-transpeptidase family protein [Beijerinckiaceae bacterium]